MVTKSEVKTTIAVAIGGAFGFIIALIWRDVIMGLLNYAGLSIDKIAPGAPIVDVLIIIIVAIVITIVCVFGILYITKWGNVEKK